MSAKVSTPEMLTRPDEGGHYGLYGGRFVPETLMGPLEELEEAYKQARRDPSFHAELEELFHSYSGRPTPLTFARRLSEYLGRGRIYLKREDLNHTGAHKINNALGQMLLARRMGKTRIIAETGAGQHGVATATVSALFGMECEIYMGTEEEVNNAFAYAKRVGVKLLVGIPFAMVEKKRVGRAVGEIASNEEALVVRHVVRHHSADIDAIETVD